MSVRYKLDNPRGHIRSLNGLRGTAILLVLLYHIYPYIKIFRMGWIGVDLFFVLSGFLITGILLDTYDHPHYWKNFIGRRILRIFPLYYFSLTILILICEFSPTIANHDQVNYEYFRENQFWYFSYLMNWKILDESFWLPVTILNIFWSLNIEEQFYIFWPLFIYILKKKAAVFILIVLLAILFLRLYLIVINNWSPIAIYTNTFTRIDTILYGALIACSLRNENWKSFLEKSTFYILIFTSLLLILLAVVSNGFYPFNQYTIIFGYSLTYIFFGSVLLSSIQKSPFLSSLRNILGNKILVFFGKYSYAIYVYHWALYLLLFPHISGYVYTCIHKKFLSDLVASTIVLFLVIVISQITWLLLERPFLKLKKYFKY